MKKDLKFNILIALNLGKKPTHKIDIIFTPIFPNFKMKYLSKQKLNFFISTMESFVKKTCPILNLNVNDKWENFVFDIELKSRKLL